LFEAGHGIRPEFEPPSRSLERSALVETSAQITHALNQIAALPATPALRRSRGKAHICRVGHDAYNIIHCRALQLEQLLDCRVQTLGRARASLAISGRGRAGKTPSKMRRDRPISLSG